MKKAFIVLSMVLGVLSMGSCEKEEPYRGCDCDYPELGATGLDDCTDYCQRIQDRIDEDAYRDSLRQARICKCGDITDLSLTFSGAIPDESNTVGGGAETTYHYMIYFRFAVINACSGNTIHINETEQYESPYDVENYYPTMRYCRDTPW